MFRMTVEDVFAIRNRGTVATGRVESGALRVGDTVRIDGTIEARADRSRRVSAHRTDGVRRLISRS
jgi:elongation factor Tu